MNIKQNLIKIEKSMSIRITTLLAIITIFVFGCNQVSQTVGGGRTVQKLEPAALQIINEGLADSDPKVRTNAIEAVSENKMIQLMPKVSRLVKDDFVPVRFAATLTIGETGYQRARATVEKLLNDSDENVRIAAIYSLARLNYSANSMLYGKNGAKLEFFKALEPLGQAITSKDQTVRANTALLLGKSNNTKMLDLLYWAQDDVESTSIVRFQTAESIARLGDEKIYQKLWTMLISKYIENRVIGIRAMGALGTAEAESALKTMLNDEVPEIRLSAAEQLAILGNNIGQQVVFEVFEKNLIADTDKRSAQRIKVLSARVIGQIGSDQLNRYLPGLLEDSSKFVKIAAADAVFKQINK
ncbi:MAG: HEAT repeat domain-containing protein [Planctomycetota bacterium]|jgi:HEAT repeat protein